MGGDWWEGRRMKEANGVKVEEKPRKKTKIETLNLIPIQTLLA